MKTLKIVTGDTYPVKDTLKGEGFKYSSLYGWNTESLELTTKTTLKTTYEYIDVQESDFEEILKLEFTPERLVELKEKNQSALMFIKKDLNTRIAAKDDVNKLFDALNSAETIELLKKVLKL